MARGCDHFEWIDDALYDRVRSMVVALMLKNESHGNDIEKLLKVGQERKAEKQSAGLLKKNNRWLKSQVNGYQ